MSVAEARSDGEGPVGDTTEEGVPGGATDRSDAPTSRGDWSVTILVGTVCERTAGGSWAVVGVGSVLTTLFTPAFCSAAARFASFERPDVSGGHVRLNASHTCCFARYWFSADR